MRSGTKKPDAMFMVVIKGALLGVLLSLLLLLLLSLALDKGWLGLTSLQSVTLVVKVLSALTAAVFALKKYKGHAILTGALTGTAYAALAYLFFSIISESFAFSLAVLGDLGIGCLCGAVAAIFLRTLRL